MGMRLWRCISVVLLGLLLGCAGGNTRPEPQPKEYSSARYLTATGIGRTEAEAKDNAVAEMSRIFESRVRSDTFDRIKSVTGPSGKEGTEQRIESSIRIISEVRLKGVEVPESWEDDQEGVHYALAVLDRYRARDAWSRDIESADQRIEAELATVQGEESPYLRMKGLQRAVALWLQREVLVSRLNVLGFSGGLSPSYDVRTLFLHLAEAKREMAITLAFSGDAAGQVEREIAEALGQAGYVMGLPEGPGAVLLRGEVTVEPVRLENPGWEFARAAVSISVVDSVTGLTVGEVSEVARAGHLTYGEAVVKAVREVSAKAARELVALFDSEQGM